MVNHIHCVVRHKKQFLFGRFYKGLPFLLVISAKKSSLTTPIFTGKLYDMDKLRLFQLFITIILASQGIFYILALAEAFKNISVPTFAETRKAIDLVIADRLRFLYYAHLLAGVIILVSCRDNIRGAIFITTLIATVLVLADVILAIKGSVPINNSFQTYPDMNADWRALQLTWLKLIVIRGTCTITALAALLFPWLNK